MNKDTIKDILPENIIEKVKTAKLWQIDAAWAVLKYRHENDRKAYGIKRKIDAINGIFGIDITPHLPKEKIEYDNGEVLDRIVDWESREIVNDLLLSYNEKRND